MKIAYYILLSLLAVDLVVLAGAWPRTMSQVGSESYEWTMLAIWVVALYCGAILVAILVFLLIVDLALALKKRPSRFQFGLRTLLLIVFVLACVMPIGVWFLGWLEERADKVPFPYEDSRHHYPMSDEE